MGQRGWLALICILGNGRHPMLTSRAGARALPHDNWMGRGTPGVGSHINGLFVTLSGCFVDDNLRRIIVAIIEAVEGLRLLEYKLLCLVAVDD